MPHQLFRFAALPITPWRNGLGRKADVCGGPEWMATFAWIDADAAFSDFAGQDRTITLLDGDGFLLEFPGRDALRVAPAWQPKPFDGGLPTFCRLLGGPCFVLNAISDRARFRHEVRIGSFPDVLPATGEYVVAVVLEGQVALPNDSAGPLDAIRLDGPLVTPDAVLAVLRFRPA